MSSATLEEVGHDANSSNESVVESSYPLPASGSAEALPDALWGLEFGDAAQVALRNHLVHSSRGFALLLAQQSDVDIVPAFSAVESHGSIEGLHTWLELLVSSLAKADELEEVDSSEVQTPSPMTRIRIKLRITAVRRGHPSRIVSDVDY
jgi:hypothetical protein